MGQIENLSFISLATHCWACWSYKGKDLMSVPDRTGLKAPKPTRFWIYPYRESNPCHSRRSPARRKHSLPPPPPPIRHCTPGCANSVVTSKVIGRCWLHWNPSPLLLVFFMVIIWGFHSSHNVNRKKKNGRVDRPEYLFEFEFVYYTPPDSLLDVWQVGPTNLRNVVCESTIMGNRTHVTHALVLRATVWANHNIAQCSRWSLT